MTNGVPMGCLRTDPDLGLASPDRPCQLDLLKSNAPNLKMVTSGKIGDWFPLLSGPNFYGATLIQFYRCPFSTRPRRPLTDQSPKPSIGTLLGCGIAIVGEQVSKLEVLIPGY